MIQDIEPHKFCNHYKVDANAGADDLIYYFEGNQLLVFNDGTEEGSIPLRTNFESDTETGIYLFQLDGKNAFLLTQKPAYDESVFRFSKVDVFRKIAQQHDAFVSLVAFHLFSWYSVHKYCGKCGSLNTHKHDERAMICTSCGALYFPKISPAIIVAILSGDKILLAHNANFTMNWYSLIAGYADVGETLEDTVRREVKEEVGIDVYNIRYYSSQPWSLSGSMMIGFIAEADENQPILIDNKEISEAAWFKRGELPTHPTNVSIAGEIIDKFENNTL